MNKDNQIRDAIEQLVAPMIEHPERLTIKLTPSQRKPIITITCDLSDYGVIIGKKGQMFAAIRHVAGLMAAHAGMTVEILLDEAGCSGERRIRGQFTENPEWTQDEMDKVANLVLPEVFGQPVNIGWDKISTTATKMTVVAPEADQQTEDALGMIFRSIGVHQGRIIKFELVSH